MKILVTGSSVVYYDSNSQIHVYHKAKIRKKTQQNKNEFLIPNVHENFETKWQWISVPKWKRNWKVLSVSHFIITNHFIWFVHNMIAKSTHHILFIMLAFDIIWPDSVLVTRYNLMLQLPAGSSISVKIHWVEPNSRICSVQQVKFCAKKKLLLLWTQRTFRNNQNMCVKMPWYTQCVEKKKSTSSIQYTLR